MTMQAHESDRLMTLVLDGEATPDETARLERELASDPALRARYAAWQGLFDTMRRLPPVHPPEGLVAHVLANIPHSGAPPGSKLPAASRVLGVGSDTVSSIRRSTRPMASLGGNMSEQSIGSFSKRKFWIGAGVAAVAVVVVGGYALDIPPTSKDTAGTIVPAQRYQATQPKAADIQVGLPTGTQTSPTDPTLQGGSIGLAAGQQAGGQAGGQAGIQAGGQAGGQAGKQAGGQAGGQAGKQAGGQAGGQAGSQGVLSQ